MSTLTEQTISTNPTNPTNPTNSTDLIDSTSNLTISNLPIICKLLIETMGKALDNPGGAHIDFANKILEIYYEMCYGFKFIYTGMEYMDNSFFSISGNDFKTASIHFKIASEIAHSICIDESIVTVFANVSASAHHTSVLMISKNETEDETIISDSLKNLETNIHISRSALRDWMCIGIGALELSL